jgi:hypothetical protein
VSDIAVLDVLYPYAGRCAFCGGWDKRHRLADSIIENVRAGDSVRLVASAYDVTEQAVEALVAYAAKRTAAHKARWPGLHA